MLVLGRKVGEEILIGDSIRVLVVGLRGNQVRLGFEAPAEVRIRRREIVDGAADPWSATGSQLPDDAAPKLARVVE